MTRSRVVRKSLDPAVVANLGLQLHLIHGFRYKLANQVNASFRSFARWTIRSAPGSRITPDRWP